MEISGIGGQINLNDLVGKLDDDKKADFEKILESAKKEESPDALKKACEDFESIFVNMLLTTMRSSVGDGGLTEKSHAREIFEGMLDEEISNSISSGGSVGIAKVLYKNLKDQQQSSFDLKG